MTRSEFAAQIRSKYPAYSGVDDEKLVGAILAKYPQYASQVSEPSVAEKAAQNQERIRAGKDLPPGALNPDQGSFVGGLRASLPTPSEFVSGLRTTADALGAEGLGKMWEADKAIASGAWRGAKDQATKAYASGRAALNDLRNGNVASAIGNGVEMMGHGYATAVPIVGPAAAHAGEQIAEGNLGQGLGEGAGLVGQMVVPTAAGKGATLATRALTPEKAALVQQYLRSFGKAADHPSAPEIAERLLDEGVVLKNPRVQIPEIAEAKAAAVPIMNRTLPAAQTEQITAPLRQMKDSLFNEVASFNIKKANGGTIAALKKMWPDARIIIKEDGTVSVQQIGHESMKPTVARLNSIDRHIRGTSSIDATETIPLPKDPVEVDAMVKSLRKQYPHGEIEIQLGRGWGRGDYGEATVSFQRMPKANESAVISNENLAKLHSDYNYEAAQNGAFDEGSLQGLTEDQLRRLPADAHAARAIQNVVNEDPYVAPGIAEKNLWLDAKKQIGPKALAEPEPYMSLNTLARLGTKAAATAAASLLGGPVGVAVGAVLNANEITKAVKSVITSPYWKTVVPAKRLAFAKLINSGDYAGAVKALGFGVPAAVASNEATGVAEQQ